MKDRVNILHVFYSIWGYTMFVLVNLTIILVTPFVFLLSLFFDKNRKFLPFVIKSGYYLFYILNFVQKTYYEKNGIQPLKKGERRIYAINHASIFDTIIMNILPGPIRSLMKESYTKIPLVGWIALAAGNIILKGSNNAGDNMSMYLGLVDTLEKGSALVIYPEGTRSKDSKVGKFHSGTFKIALDTQSDIVPVVFDTWNVIRPGQFWIRDVQPSVKILEAIPYEKVKDFKRKELSDLVRMRIIEGLLELRELRRKKDKWYYRHCDKYVKADEEMKEELKLLQQKFTREII